MELDYLIIAAHPDDAELAMGGTILALKASGATVGVLDLTSGEPTPHGSPEIRIRETEAASRILALDWRGNLGLANRSLVADLEARQRLAGTIRQLKPRVLLTHYWDDAHPDHVAASALVVYWLFNLLDSWATPLTQKLFGHHIPGLGSR